MVIALYETALFAQVAGRSVIAIIGLVVLLGVILAAAACFTNYLRLWLRSVRGGAGIGLLELLAMTFQTVPPKIIVDAKIIGVEAGLDHSELNTLELRAFYLAGCDVRRAVRLMIDAKRKHKKMTFREAAELDLAGKR